MNMRNTIALILLTIIAAIGAVHYLALWYEWYGTVWWIDIPLHLLGGAFIGVLFVYLVAVRRDILGKTDALSFLVLGVGFVALIGILWEFYEFWADVWFLKKYALNEFPGWIHADTLKDLLNDLIGGAAAIVALHALMKKKK